MDIVLGWMGGVLVGALGSTTWYVVCRIHAIRSRLPWWFRL